MTRIVNLGASTPWLEGGESLRIPSGRQKGFAFLPPLMSNVCAVHGTNPAGCKSRYQVSAEPKVSQRASASSRGGVRRKLKPKSRGDEQKPDMRRDASGASGHVTAKPSICKSGAMPGWMHFVNPAPMRGRIRVLPREICAVSLAWEGRATGRRATGAEYRAEVSRGHSRPGAPGRRPER